MNSRYIVKDVISTQAIDLCTLKFQQTIHSGFLKTLSNEYLTNWISFWKINSYFTVFS